MTIIDKQKSLDENKWLKSEELGRDACGEFDYCKFCSKEVEHPCANAWELMNQEHRIVIDAPEAKKATKKTTKKSTTKKTTTKKTTAKKTTKKTTAKKTTKK